jgi:hypothetical protein
MKVAAFVFAGAAGCSASSAQLPDCYGVDPGDRMSVAVLDTLSAWTGAAEPANACDFGWDIARGQVLTATDAKNVDGAGQCLTADAQFEPFGGWTWKINGDQQGAPDTVLTGIYSATRDTCTAYVQILVKVSGTDPFAASLAGKTPVAVMTRQFSGCGKVCIDSYVVDLQRL